MAYFNEDKTRKEKNRQDMKSQENTLPDKDAAIQMRQ